MQRTFSGSLFDGGIEAMRPCIMGTRHMVSAANHAAAHVAFTVLENGGNAVDAGVAGGIALSVVQSDIVNFAGVAPAMAYLAATDEVLTVSGLGCWPRRVTPDFFMRHHGGRIPEGVLRCLVPAAPDSWITCLERFGTLSFAEAAGPAIALARDGFPATQFLVDQVTQFQAKYRAYPASAAIYLPGGQPPQVAHRFVQQDLARTMQYMADQEAAALPRGRGAGLQAARDAFYKGDIMRAIVDFHAGNGGLLAEEDMAAFSVEVAPALSVRSRGIEVHACPPWCQGPVLLQALAILDGDTLAELGHNSAEYVHLVAEALNLAFADRDALYTDPRFGSVPMAALLSRDYAVARRRLIRPGQAFGAAPPSGMGQSAPGQGLRDLVELGSRDTSYIAVVDRHGNAFSATPSDNSFESPVVPGTGLCPSSRGSQSWADPAHPGSVAPGKRPRLTPSPAMARMPDGGLMPFGSPGGDVQPQAMLQALLNIVVFGMTLQEAVEAPRFASASLQGSFEPHAYNPGALLIEQRVPPDTRKALAAWGHVVEDWPAFTWKAGAVCAARQDKRTGVLSGGADPRRPAYAVGR